MSAGGVQHEAAPMQVVWFKRDLRVHDHAPLVHALRAGPVLALWVYEPSLLAQPDCAAQHIAFANECLAELRDALADRGIALVTRVGEMPQVLDDLRREGRLAALWSHEETGNAASYARDRRVGAWCRAHGVRWHEAPSNGVVRQLRDRDEWSRIWMARMSRAPLQAPGVVAPLDLCGDAWCRGAASGGDDGIAGSIADDLADGAAHRRTVAASRIRSAGIVPVDRLPVAGQDKPLRQRGGRAQALALLDSFFADRGRPYRAAMASPLTAPEACSRLSPHIAWGTVSVRELMHRLWAERARWQASGDPARRDWLAAIKSLESRLHWQSHFIQKLESAPAIETRNQHRAYDGLREDADPALLAAWAEGRTGLPMVDACMRMLLTTGWLNFRMRAMLVSVATQHLWQPWRPVALHLAREFLDYEPGIHYPQVQMQCGVTGINTVRIYNPVKQARDLDPTGAFVRRWVPELAQVPQAFIFEPWTMPEAVQAQAGCVIGRDYPSPVVDPSRAAAAARERVWGVRGDSGFQAEARAIWQRHGSRHPQREGRKGPRGAQPAVERQRATDDPQLSLFGG